MSNSMPLPLGVHTPVTAIRLAGPLFGALLLALVAVGAMPSARTPAIDHLRIVNVRVVGSSEGWVEISNAGSTAIDLATESIAVHSIGADGPGIDRVPLDGTLGPHESIVVEIMADAGGGYVVLEVLDDLGMIRETGDRLDWNATTPTS